MQERECISAEQIAPIKSRARIALADPDEERECLRCHETMAAPDFEHEAAPVCDGCAHWLAAELAEDAERLIGNLHAKDEEISRLRSALESVLEVCRDRQEFVMHGPRAFAKAETIALKALGKRSK